MILAGTSFRASDIYTTIDSDALFAAMCGYMIVFIEPGIIVFTDKMLEWFVN
jgi:hypothetical protein